MLIFPPDQGSAPEAASLFYSLKGPGAMHAPLLVSSRWSWGLGVGFIAQRSRFCTMGRHSAILILFRQAHLLLVALLSP